MKTVIGPGLALVQRPRSVNAYNFLKGNINEEGSQGGSQFDDLP